MQPTKACLVAGQSQVIAKHSAHRHRAFIPSRTQTFRSNPTSNLSITPCPIDNAMRLPTQISRLSAVRCGAAPRIGSAQSVQLLRLSTCLEGGRHFTSVTSQLLSRSPAYTTLTQRIFPRTLSLTSTKTPRAQPSTRVAVEPRTARAYAATMHRAPAAMVTKPVDVQIRTPRDPNTLSNYHNFVTRHTSVDFEIDFEHKILSGAVGIDLESLTDEDVREIVLDSR